MLVILKLCKEVERISREEVERISREEVERLPLLLCKEHAQKRRTVKTLWVWCRSILHCSQEPTKALWQVRRGLWDGTL
jgi:hypothetical protein